MAVRCGAGHGKSGALLARGCFLLFLLPLLLLLDEARALTARQPDLALGSIGVKFRGTRSALMHPTATSFSPPNKRRRQPSQHLRGGSSSSSFMPPGVVSRAPSTRSQMPSHAADTITPAPHTPRTHIWASGADSHPPQPTVIGFGLDGPTPLRPAKWNRPQASHTLTEGGRGWAGMNTPAVQGKLLTPLRPQHTPVLTDSASSFGRQDTFGLALSEDLSHLHDRPSGRRQTVTVVSKSPGSGGDKASSRVTTHTIFNGRSHPTHLWPNEEEVKDDREIDDEGEQSLFDSNSTSEYQPDDYSAYHEYDHSNTSWRPPEQTPSPLHDQGILSYQHVMEIQNLTSQADLHALLEQRGIAFDTLRTFLNSGAQKKDVLEFLKPPTPSTTTTTTTTTPTSPPVLSYPPYVPDVSAIQEDYQDDVLRQASLPATETENEDDDTNQESKERSRKNRNKGRRGKKGRRRKNKRRKGKKGQKEASFNVSASPSLQVENMTQTPAPDPWVPTTPRTFPEITFTTTTATRGILLPITQPPMPDTLTTVPSSVRTSDVSIVSVTLMETPSAPQPETPGQTTFVEGATPSRRQNTHNTTNLWEEQNPTKTLHPARSSPEPDRTITEIKRVNFVREKHRDDYVFPLRGLLIISGLMGALAVFTLVVLISYAVIKCSKKPVVNNYQVSEQQKPAGT